MNIDDMLPPLYDVRYEGPGAEVVRVERRTLCQKQRSLPSEDDLEKHRLLWFFGEIIKLMEGISK